MQEKMKIKAAIFDMDGTLVDSLMFWGDFARRINDRYLGRDGFVLDAELDAAIRTMLFADAMRLVRAFYDIPVSDADFLAFAEDGIADFYRHTVKPKAGVIAMLDHLRKNGVKLALASATDMKYIRIATECCGLSEYFPIILSCVDIGKGKDQPDIYLAAIDALGTQISETCVFEDSAVALETAHRVGLMTVGVYDLYTPDHARVIAVSDRYLAAGEGMETLSDAFTF